MIDDYGRLTPPSRSMSVGLRTSRRRGAIGTPERVPVTEAELAEMEPRRVAKTASRSVVGVMNEFAYLADVYAKVDGGSDLLALSMRLTGTPCGPLYKRHISPDRELAALVASAAD